MVEQRLPAAAPPQVQLLAAPVVVEVGGAVAEPLLDARPRGQRAAAAERHGVRQVLALHVAPQPAAGRHTGGRR